MAKVSKIINLCIDLPKKSCLRILHDQQPTVFTMQLTSEQAIIINSNHNLVINAVAGSGKTTTLLEYAKSRPAGSKILYLAFNKTVKTEAIEKFTAAGLKQVKVETAHSLAFDHVIKHSHYTVVQAYQSYEWCDLLGIQSGDRHTDFIIASHVNKFIAYFCNSKAGKVQELNYTDVVNDAKAKTFVNNFYLLIEKFTREALAKMNSGEISVTHDFYLKKFQLNNPVLQYDYILFDEGQDASPCMLDVFLKQQAIKIIVGDRHQQIYGWRFAINSLEQVDFPVYNLSSSFRFDDEIALIANKILAWKKHLKEDAAVKIIGAGPAISPKKSRATLGRTNLSLLLNAIAQRQHGDISTVYFEGNINSYTFADEGASLYDVLNLHLGKKEKIKDKLIAEMKTMKELEDYIAKTEDNALGMIVEVVKEFGSKLPGLISELKNNHTADKSEADMIFSTVHRCKGMEYDEVILLKDFMQEDKLKKQIALMGGDKISDADKGRLAEEINVLYVAATRAKQKLVLPPEINPLQSIVVSEQPVMAQPLTSRYARSFAEDYELYSRTASGNKRAHQKSNQGKRWTDEEVEQLETLYNNASSIKEIATELGRGENGIRAKLIGLGLMDESDIF